jgi:hypothetical protein
MLERLLNEIRSGGTYEASTLALRLGTTPEMVQAMLDHLQRMGMLQPYQKCSDGCVGCNLQSGCRSADSSDGLRLWQY